MGTFGSDNGGFQKGNVVLDIIKGIFAALAAVWSRDCSLRYHWKIGRWWK